MAVLQSSTPLYVVSREYGWQSSDSVSLSALTSKIPPATLIRCLYYMLMALFNENQVFAIASTKVELFADSVPCYCGQVPKLLTSCCPLHRLKCAHLMDVQYRSNCVCAWTLAMYQLLARASYHFCIHQCAEVVENFSKRWEHDISEISHEGNVVTLGEAHSKLDTCIFEHLTRGN